MLLTLSLGRLDWTLNLFEIKYFFVQICMFCYFFDETQLALMGYELTKPNTCTPGK